MSPLTRADIQARIQDGRDNNRCLVLSELDLSGLRLSGLDLQDADLRGADLRRADLRRADLRDADLRRADLRGADLRGADLRGADLRDADLQYADLQYADLRRADLRGAGLWRADLRRADLRDADLRRAGLRGTDLRDAYWDGLVIDRLPSGRVCLIPTCDGWYMHAGCWKGTPDELRRLIAQDKGWPAAEGKEITRRRPYLEAALALCEVHMADHTEVIDNLRERWKSAEEAAA